MKKLGKFFANLLIFAYAVIAIAVTVLLLSYNEYHCSVLGGYTFVLLTDNELEENGYPEGSLVLVKETKAKNINPGDNVFLYRQISASQFEIKYAEVILKDTTRGEYDVQYVLEGSTVVDHEDVIGKAENVKIIPHLGTILSILESRYGYLFLIVVVSFIAFLYEIYELIMEIKYGEREEDGKYHKDYDEEYDEEDEYYEEEVVVRPKKTTRTATVRKSTTNTSPTKKTTTRATAEPRKTTTTRTNTTAKTSETRKTTTKKKTATPKE